MDNNHDENPIVRAIAVIVFIAFIYVIAEYY